MVCKLKYNTMKWMCRERKKKPACLDGKQAGVNDARQMCRELNRQIELSGYRDSERGDRKLRKFWTANANPKD